MLGKPPSCLLDVVERHQSYDVVSWLVLVPTGGTSGYFHCREDALHFAKELYPDLPEDRVYGP
jgi:hypothetical protein